MYRFEDKSQDGDYNEASEGTLFFMRADLTRAVDRSTVIAVDYASMPGQVQLLWLQDLDGNGDALGAGESHVWYSGALPGGGTLSLATGITRTSDGAVYLVHPGSTTNPSIIYKLIDSNGNGNADDPGELVVAFQSAPGAIANRIAVDAQGDLWYADHNSNGDIYRVHAGTSSLQITFAALQTKLGVFNISDRLATLADGSIVYGSPQTVLARLYDANADGVVTPDEVMLLYNGYQSDFICDMTDLEGLPDGSVFAIDSGNPDGALVFRFVDSDHDGAFLSRGEVYVAHDEIFAGQAGQHALAGMGAITATMQ